MVDRDAPCEMKLQSFAIRELELAVDREKVERVELTGRIVWMFALMRLEKVARRAGYRLSDVTRREGEDGES